MFSSITIKDICRLFIGISLVTELTDRVKYQFERWSFRLPFFYVVKKPLWLNNHRGQNRYENL